MALNPFSRPTKLMSFSSILLLLAMLMPVAKPQSPRETTIVLYLQDLASGPDATVVPITGIQGKPQSFTSFGTIFAVDDVITETPDKVSAQIGRAQGILVASSLSGSNVHVSMSLAFTNVEYNGSSLEIQGISRQFERYKEVSVVSGTGSFRYARGYATLETVFYDNKTFYSIIRCTVRLLPNSQ
ncbi:PREDICTED: dirigent protein 22-like [Prunus mume]|uniref:Dirigent protein n=1 Tax=Prunus mume TaxID=102107 RepID=A0ABM0NUD5_PRUMU|nr:PREDICTED: dirigent protein 22-like [Prunus mume]